MWDCRHKSVPNPSASNDSRTWGTRALVWCFEALSWDKDSKELYHSFPHCAGSYRVVAHLLYGYRIVSATGFGMSY
eukprot:3606146-Rhodomonas_salina.2